MVWLRQTAFFACGKRPENIYDPEDGNIRSAKIAHAYRGRFQACKAKDSPPRRDSHDSRWPLPLMRDSPARGPISPDSDGAPPEVMHHQPGDHS